MNDASRPTERTVRVEDVARVAGVSPITVSRALRTPDIVRPETRRRVEEAVARTGYVVNSIASSLRSGQSAFITVCVASLQHIHYAAAMQGMIDAFEGSRFRLTFSQSGYDEDLSAETLRGMLPFRPAAFVFAGIVRSESAREYLDSLDIPVLELWGEAEPIDMLVSSPGREGGRLMGEHIAEQGFSRIAYIGHTGSRTDARINSLRGTLQRHGLDIALLHSTQGTTDMEDGIAVVDTVLEQLPGCDLMVFGTDVMAAGAMVRLQEMGVDVPGDIGILGYGDLFFAAHTRPSLTTVRTRPYEVGQRAGRLLRERLVRGRVDQPIIQVPLTLEVRDSTRRKS